MVRKPYGGVGSSKKRSYDHGGDSNYSKAKKARTHRWAAGVFYLNLPGLLLIKIRFSP